MPRVKVCLCALTLNERGSLLSESAAEAEAKNGKKKPRFGGGASKGGATVEHVRVEVDMLGTEREPMRTEVTKLTRERKGGHSARLVFSREYRAAPDSKLAFAYLKALGACAK